MESFKRIVFIFTFIIYSISLYANNSDAIIRAMRDEIKRSMKELKLEKLQQPYYIEYTLTLQNSYNISATLGSLTISSNSKTAKLNVGLRIGDYKFDNTNFFDMGLSFFGSGDDEETYKNRNVPIELDYSSLRRELWLATDAAYKQQSEIFTKKEATLKNRLRKDTTYDFIKLPPEVNYDTTEIPIPDIRGLEDIARKISAIFLNYKNIDISNFSIEYLPSIIYYSNSEGREYIKNELYSGLEVVAAAQVADGMPVVDFYSEYAPSPDKFSSEDSLAAAVNKLASNISRFVNANILDESYSGPVLFEEQAAAELIAQVFAPNLVAQRQSMTETGMQDFARNDAFQTKIGGRVLPEFISVYAKPTLKKFEKTTLSGYYKIDEQGVKSKDVLLVQNGFLKNLLSSRVPTKRVRESNGHCRGGAAMLSNIVFDSDTSHKKSSAELKQQIIRLCKDRELPYGLIVRKILNQNIQFTTLSRLVGSSLNLNMNFNIIPLIEVYKIYTDGHEEPLRGCEINGLTVQSFKDILFVGNKHYALNYLAPAVVSPFITGGSQYIGCSIITPDLLFEDCEVRQFENDFPKPPIIANPIRN